MRRIITIFVVLLFGVSQLMAVVARPKASIFNQPNGYMLESLLKGDEYFHFRKTTDNYVLLLNNQGYLTYAVKNTQGELVPSEVVAHNPADRTTSENAFLNTIAPNMAFGKVLLTTVQTNRLARNLLRKKQVVMRSGVPQTGATKFLVILVNFSDNTFTVPSTQTRYNEQFNAASYTTGGAVGSVKKYFEDNSSGKFSPTFDVYGPVKMSKTMAYYGGNDAQGNDLHPDEMIFEACQLLDSQINFADYDANNDGKVDNVYVIYAGYGEASGASANTIWPHQWEVTNTTKLDGKLVSSYSCSNELDGTSGSTIDGVGTACHEFSHAVGLPDFYDTDYDVNGQSVDTDTWDVMASGAYNGSGMIPPYYTSIERELTGWASPIVLSSPANITLNTVNTNQFYKILTKTPDEYYLIENRQKSGWDAGLYSHGMIVYHIDKTAPYLSRWTTDNMVNAYSVHQCADLVEADGTEVYYTGSNLSAWQTSVAGDPFPGSKGITSWTDATTPSMKSWAGAATGVPITSIAEVNGVITFKVMGGETPFGQFSAMPASEVTANSFTANWSASTGATKYLLNVYTKTTTNGGASTIVLSENFDKFTAGTTGSGANSTDVSASLDTYTQTPGWTGLKVYQAGGAAKMGSSSSLGSLTTPSLDLSANNGAFNVSFKSMAWATDSTKLKIYLNDVLVKTVSGLTKDYTLTPFSVDLTGGTSTSKIRFEGAAAAKGRFFLEDLTITGGQGSSTVITKVLTDQEVLSGTSFAVSGLDNTSSYFYTVKAANATVTSIESNEVEVSLLTGINQIQNSKFGLYAAQGMLTVTSPTNEVVRVYNAMGRLVKVESLASGVNNISLPSHQMYVVKIGSFVGKAMVR
ncbi:MAG: M6 family metalloprotease domain-containing protein [Bacteroidales bacterium]|nr:M6 family metalloprotease domain-containing protein [Bacteroidales bacterium]